MNKKAYLGIDIGSISTKGVIIDEENRFLAECYLWTEGNPTQATKKVLHALRKQFDEETYQIAASGTTGSARKLVGSMIGAQVVKNEITAHAVGTTTLHPDVRTILEIGGQDSKIICVENGVAVDYAMNTLCAAGTGAFLSSQAHRLGVEVEEMRRVMDANPDAKAVFINNPTYYGICSNLKKITEMAHERGMKVLVDEAHGTHLYFGENLPVSGMAAGADLAAVSMHKSGGSLTQSSILLCGPDMDAGYVRQIINLTQTTSASYLLLSSLDISRRNLALRGKESFAKVVRMAEYARNEINEIGGYYAYGKDLVDGDSVYDYDVTKLSVYTQGIGLTGIEVYDILRDEYDIQIEFGDIGNILAYISIGDRIQDIERLVGALEDIGRSYEKDSSTLYCGDFIQPEVVCTPQEAFYADKRQIPIRETAGAICAELVMCYPPGIPILTPGERITGEIIEYILYAKEKGCSLQGTQDPSVQLLNVIV